jgi:hypothetical protein
MDLLMNRSSTSASTIEMGANSPSREGRQNNSHIRGQAARGTKVSGGDAGSRGGITLRSGASKVEERGPLERSNDKFGHRGKLKEDAKQEKMMAKMRQRSAEIASQIEQDRKTAEIHAAAERAAEEMEREETVRWYAIVTGWISDIVTSSED